MASTAKSIYPALTDRLKALGADKGQLMQVANKFAELSATEILGYRIWVRGIPAFDQIGVSVVVSSSSLPNIIRDFTANEALQTVVIFPYGIPSFETFEVQATLGNVPLQQETLL
jgi:hypothetical protein